jgi:4-diphosphocytidyl-2-C-methyl-D-erythritol kinase
VFTRFGDRLTVENAEVDTFTTSGPFGDDVPLGEDNLVIAARERLRVAFPLAECPPAAIELVKNVPVASGLGGGSSDAAATLVALSSLWELSTTKRELARLCPALGADVPMCLTAKPLLATGIGEQIAKIPGFPPLNLVLVNPGVPVGTANVFRALSTFENSGLPPLPATLTLAHLVEWLNLTRNDLQPTAADIAPEIDDAVSELAMAGALVTRMSGSGATCFGLFETAAQAKGAARHIERQRPGWFVVATESEGAEKNVAD